MPKIYRLLTSQCASVQLGAVHSSVINIPNYQTDSGDNGSLIRLRKWRELRGNLGGPQFDDFL